MLILVTDVGKFVCMYLSTTESEVNYTLKTVGNNFGDQIQHFTCNSVVFSKNQCTCALTLQYVKIVNIYLIFHYCIKQYILGATQPNIVKMMVKSEIKYFFVLSLKI